MPQVKGTELTVALFEEDTFGADPGTPDGQKLYVTGFGLQDKQSRNPSATLSNDRSMEEPVLGNIDAGGQLPFELHAESMGTLHKHLFGAVSTTGVGPYVHEFTIGSLPTSLLVERDHGAVIAGAGRFEKHNGNRIASATFSFPQEGAPTAVFNFLGSGMTAAAAALDATVTDNGMTPFSMFEATILEGGGAIAVVTAAELTLDNGLDTGVYTIGGAGKRRALPEGFATIRGRITALFEDMTLLNKAVNGTESSLKITLSRGDGAGSAGNESMEYEVQQLKYDRTSPGVNGPAGVSIDLPFIAYRKVADLGFKATIKNAVVTV